MRLYYTADQAQYIRYWTDPRSPLLNTRVEHSIKRTGALLPRISVHPGSLWEDADLIGLTSLAWWDIMRRLSLPMPYSPLLPMQDNPLLPLTSDTGVHQYRFLTMGDLLPSGSFTTLTVLLGEGSYRAKGTNIYYRLRSTLKAAFTSFPAPLVSYCCSPLSSNEIMNVKVLLIYTQRSQDT